MENSSALVSTPVSTMVIDEEQSTTFEDDNAFQHREKPKHSSQTDFSSFIKLREEEEKEMHFDYHINSILNAFAKQYIREFIKMKIKSTVYDTIDKELNRKAFVGIPQYYHLRKHINKSNNEFENSQNISKNHSNAQGFQPVYSLRIASSRTEIGADKNEYTSYIIVGSRICPFDSKVTVCVKRFVELRTFASEIDRRLKKIGKYVKLQDTFPFHHRLFGSIDKKKLEERRALMNSYLQAVCEDENAVRHSYFLQFFDFHDKRNPDDIKDKDDNTDIHETLEHDFRLKCIEETLEIIGMPSTDEPNDDSDSESEILETELNFEVPYDLHHYKNPEYKLIAAIFDIIQQQLEMEETYTIESMIKTDTNEHKLNGIISENAEEPPTNSNIGKSRHGRKLSGGSGGQVVKANRHLRTTSIIESSFTPAKPMEFHPSISTQSGKIQNIITSSTTTGWTANQFKNKFHSSIRGLDGGPRIIRTASESTSDRSLSYKIPTMVAEVWSKITTVLNEKNKSIPILLNSLNKDLYPIIQEAIHDVAPIIKTLYNNTPNNYGVTTPFEATNSDDAGSPTTPTPGVNNGKNAHSKQHDGLENGGKNGKPFAHHSKYLSMFGHGYDADEESSSDSDGDETRRSIGIRHFPFIKAMRQYCITQNRLYEFFLAFENLAIDQIFGDINVVYGSNGDKKSDVNAQNNNTNIMGSRSSDDLKSNDAFMNKNPNMGKRNSAKLGRNSMKMVNYSRPSQLRNKRESVDFSEYFKILERDANAKIDPKLPSFQFIDLLKYNYNVLQHTSSAEFGERIRHIERIHAKINVMVREVMYATLKCMMKCLGDLILYKDQLEETFVKCSNTFDKNVVSSHEDKLLHILRDSGYNISFIVDDLKQKIKSEFKDYSSGIFNPLLQGISTIGEISLNCICLMVSQFVFDDGQFPNNIMDFRSAFIEVWYESIDYYISDFAECVFYVLYQSSIGLVQSASSDLLQNMIFNASATGSSHSSSLWFQILQGRESRHFENLKKLIPQNIAKNISIKDILDLVIERTLTNMVDETLIYVRIECEKKFFRKFEKQAQRLFNF